MGLINISTCNSTIRSKIPIHNIKSDLYSIVQTASFLKKRYDSGLVEEVLYFKQLSQFYLEISELQNALIPWNLKIFDILEEFNIDTSIKSVLSVISSIKDYEYDTIAHRWQVNPFELSSKVAQITSNLITIIDYLHLVDEIDDDLLLGFAHELNKNLSQYYLFNKIHEELLEIIEYIKQTSQDLYSSPQFIQHMEQIFYNMFQEFKNALK